MSLKTHKEDQKVPQFTVEQVDYLARIFPDRAPDLETPERQLWAAVGAVNVVRHLRSLLTRQEK